MLKSMTGFGRASSTGNDVTIWAEISSLNHRHLDIGVRLSSPLNIFESEVRKMVQARIDRGRVNVSLTIEGNPPEANQLEFNDDLARQYLDAVRQFADEMDIKDDVTTTSVLRLGTLWTLKTPRAEEVSGLWELAENALSDATDQLLEMRRTEGENIWKDLAEHIRHIRSIAEKIGVRAPSIVDEYRERLRRRIDSIAPPATELDEQRLVTEVALFAERADIAEELTRLQSHVDQFNALARNASNVGRRLDFLIQEMVREVTTIGSKARDTEISHAVVEVKGLLEKIREQVQNIE